MQDSISFDRIATTYDKTRSFPPEIGQQIATALIHLGEIPEKGNVLEIGIGTGRIALPLLANGVNVTGIDISPQMIKHLYEKQEEEDNALPGQEWGRLLVELADMTALPFASESFDAVVAVHVMHLVPQWRLALDEAQRVLRPAGAFLLGQDGYPASMWRFQQKWREIMQELGFDPAPIGAQGYKEVVNELRERGLAVEESVVARWEIERTPRELLQQVAERTRSTTWDIPEDLFAESLQQLTQWAQQQFAGTLDVPERLEATFKVAHATRVV
jgi:ubiquinone/menaquinone biosynthesis C-methylase UbiE